MANGGSRAPYIIICNGRIDVALSRSGYEMIRAASHAATALVSYYGDKVGREDTEPISKLQHEMMDLVEGKTTARTREQPNSAAEMVDEMFALLDVLEDKIK